MTTAFGVPVKVTVALCPEQTVALEAMVTVGGGTTVMVMLPVAGAVQTGVPADVTLTRLYVVVAVKLAVIVAVPAALSTMVWLAPPVLYVTVAFGVPVKVTVALCPEQILVLALMLTVGKGLTVMVMEPVSGVVQLGVPAEATLTKV